MTFKKYKILFEQNWQIIINNNNIKNVYYNYNDKIKFNLILQIEQNNRIEVNHFKKKLQRILNRIMKM